MGSWRANEWARIHPANPEPEGRIMKKLRCVLGFHRWVTAVTAGERYLKCRDCGKYGGVPGSFSAGWGYKP